MAIREASAAIKKFISLEQSSGILLVFAALVAFLIANSSWAAAFNDLLKVKVGPELGPVSFTHSIHHWINDGLMAVFFLLVGLEIKRELIIGELAKAEQRILPIAATIGGVLFPALIFALINWNAPESLRGWAIPAATDIAFALGVLSLFGKRVPQSLRVYLTTVAVLDDLVAILIIAFFYTHSLDASYLVFALLPLLFLFILNRNRVRALTPYALFGFLLWFCMLKSGVHATVAGVLTAFFVPLQVKQGADSSDGPLERLERRLHPWVSYAIMPLFALANAGLPLEGLSLQTATEALPLGIIAGLFVGKQIGLFGMSALCIRVGLAKLPEAASLTQLYGVSVLGGIGFTMSLFIGSLAFHSEELVVLTRLGVIVGSLFSVVLGVAVLARKVRTSKI